MDSPFEILRIDPDADDEEIHRAYRQRAKETHPDQGGSSREFRLVKTAYEEILDGYSVDEDGGDWSDNGDLEDDLGQEDQSDSTGHRVEYLNYEVLDDYGWSLDDQDLFEKAAVEGIESPDYGHFTAESGRSLLSSAEDQGLTWPYSCRGGACANCAVAVTEGDLSMPASHVLSPELMDRGFQLSCVGVPVTEELKIVYNVKHVPDLEDLRLPPGPFERAHSDD